MPFAARPAGAGHGMASDLLASLERKCNVRQDRLRINQISNQGDNEALQASEGRNGEVGGIHCWRANAQGSSALRAGRIIMILGA